MSRNAQITFVGNLTADPEVRYSEKGNAWVTFGVAVNESRKVGDDWEEETSFLNCKILNNDLATNVGDSLTKGTRVLVTATPKQREWEDKDTGAKRTALEFVVDEIGASLRWATVTVTKTERKAAADDAAPAKGDDFFESTPY